MANIQDVVADFARKVAQVEQSNVAAIQTLADQANQSYTTRTERVTAALNELATAAGELSRANKAVNDALDKLAAIENDTAGENVSIIEGLRNMAFNNSTKRLK
jgi:predicted regulator of Ras-like GTPase activity (Roadblock/LC7/MglB family)